MVRTKWHLHLPLLALALLGGGCLTAGQGLLPPTEPASNKPTGASNMPAAILGSNYVSSMSRKYIQAVQDAQATYARGPKIACSDGKCPLGSPAEAAGIDPIVLTKLATSPFSYSLKGTPALLPSIDQQECQTCTAMAVVSAAETAIAIAEGVDANKADLSEMHLFYCGTPANSCFSTGWKLEDALKKLQGQSNTILQGACLPYWYDEAWGSAATKEDTAEICEQARKCKYVNPFANMGRFEFDHLTKGAWQVMEYIRTYGGVVAQFDVDVGFKPFYKNAAKKGAVYQRTNQTIAFYHAVQIIGYNLTATPPYWIAKNSWGSGWADSGTFKFAFNLISFENTWGLRWVSDKARELCGLGFSPERPGCCQYKVRLHIQDCCNGQDSSYTAAVRQHRRDQALKRFPARHKHAHLWRANSMLCCGLCSRFIGSFPKTKSGVYTLTLAGQKTKVYCDMETDGGGWTLILNYFHAADTKVAPQARQLKDGFPLLDLAHKLGDDGNQTQDSWGHMAPAALAALPPIRELRFYGRSSSHSRTLHFKTNETYGIKYATSGSGSFNVNNLRSNRYTTALAGHSTELPFAATDAGSNKGNAALLDGPFYIWAKAHWSVGDNWDDANRWEVDDYDLSGRQTRRGGGQYSTVHQVWIRELCNRTLKGRDL